MDTFIPFIMDIVEQYYKNTPNVDNKNASLQSLDKQLEVSQSEEETQAKTAQVTNVVDSSILQHVLDLLCSLLKYTKTDDDFEKIVAVFPQLLSFIERSEDMFLLLHGTTALKTFIHLAHVHVLKLVSPDRII